LAIDLLLHVLIAMTLSLVPFSFNLLPRLARTAAKAGPETHCVIIRHDSIILVPSFITQMGRGRERKRTRRGGGSFLSDERRSGSLVLLVFLCPILGHVRGRRRACGCTSCVLHTRAVCR
jgi:hypothetical protein